MARTAFLQIRLTEGDRLRIHKIATTEHLDDAAWARQQVLKAVDAWEKNRAESLEPPERK